MFFYMQFEIRQQNFVDSEPKFIKFLAFNVQ